MIEETFMIVYLTVAFALYYLDWGFPFTKPYSDSCGLVFNVATNTYYYYHRICSDPNYELVCENNRSVLYLNYGRHSVHAIYATNSTLQSITGGVDNNNCSAITHRSLTYNNFSHVFSAKERELHPKGYDDPVGELVFISCENPLSPLYTGIAVPCTSGAPDTHYSYVLSRDPSISELEETCKIDLMVNVVPWGPMICNENCSYPQVQSEEVKGIEIKWRANRCGEWEGGEPDCWLENTTNMVLCRPPAVAFGEHSLDIVIILYSCEEK